MLATVSFILLRQYLGVFFSVVATCLPQYSFIPDSDKVTCKMTLQFDTVYNSLASTPLISGPVTGSQLFSNIHTLDRGKMTYFSHQYWETSQD